MKSHPVVLTLTGVLLSGMLGQGVLLSASAYDPTRSLMDAKGYSNETIRHTEVQRDKQQWITPKTDPLTPKQRLWRNFYYGDWTATVDDFGREKLREYPWWDEDKKAY